MYMGCIWDNKSLALLFLLQYALPPPYSTVFSDAGFYVLPKQWLQRSQVSVGASNGSSGETRCRFPLFLLVPFDAMEKEKKRSLER